MSIMTTPKAILGVNQYFVLNDKWKTMKDLIEQQLLSVDVNIYFQFFVS